MNKKEQEPTLSKEEEKEVSTTVDYSMRYVALANKHLTINWGKSIDFNDDELATELMRLICVITDKAERQNKEIDKVSEITAMIQHLIYSITDFNLYEYLNKEKQEQKQKREFPETNELLIVDNKDLVH